MAVINSKQAVDWVVENGPHQRERVRVMIRATRKQALDFLQDAMSQKLQQLFLRRAIPEDYKSGLMAANQNIDQVIAAANR